MPLLGLAPTHLLAAEPLQLQDEADRINYTIGQQIGGDFKRQQIELDAQALRQGLSDGQAGTSAIPEDERKHRLAELKRKITDEMRENTLQHLEKHRAQVRKKREEAKRFLAENQKRPGVKTMPSGMQYKLKVAGKGPRLRAYDLVTFNYRAMQLNGRVFDSSDKKGRPASYRVEQLPPALAEAMQLMRPGASFSVYAPPDLAYGKHGPLADQGVIYEIELLGVKRGRVAK